MMKNPRSLRSTVVAASAATVAVTALSACGHSGPPQYSAIVNGAKITSKSTNDLFNSYINSSDGKTMASDMGRKAVLQAALSYQIELALLNSLAKSRGISTKPLTAGQTQIFNSLITQAMTAKNGMSAANFTQSMQTVVLTQTMAAALFPSVTVSDSELHDQYSQDAGQLQQSYVVQADVSVFKDNVGTQLQGLLDKGTSFTDASTQLGALQTSNFKITPITPFPQTFLTAISSTPTGQLSQPVQAGANTWIIGQVDDHETLPQLSFDQAKDSLTTQVRQTKQASLFYNWFDQQAASANVKVSRYYGYWVPSSLQVRDKKA